MGGGLPAPPFLPLLSCVLCSADSPLSPRLGDEGAACSPISITDSGLQITQCHL